MNSLIKDLEVAASNTLYVPIDVETGGLAHATRETNPELPDGVIGAQGYPILEITAKFIDGNFKEIAEPMTFVIHHDLAYLEEKCSKWVKDKFGDNLFVECSESTNTLDVVDGLIAERIKSIGAKNSYILGNSVDLDRAFVFHQMKKISSALHYRIIDISTLKTIFGDIYGEFATFAKKETHRTEMDITETLEEFAFYRKHFIKSREEFLIELSRPKNKLTAK